ncbi:MAG: hypothetical protein GTO51_06400 [Candidatus Latescibacteria bacterium]|nr:hypothetical protein [Candidatus Latescibacterota bacterium]NIM21422.1 hypothetical protein [Candidatus Latescibacterota bacterium]NIM65603.1 hypothetical protein [Candidatus Latescibacterota bacterium]NIO01983.1 hypothetical protein [Candidatus Latescibacterota bacterium]NIO28795.1 hypothetical protein [Candidatus Latescibacterota bacterium]
MAEEYSFSWGGGDEEALRITAKPSPIFVDTCKFMADREIYPESAVHFASKEASTGSPLAERLFDIGEIDQVLIAGNSVSIVVQKPQNWETFAPRIASAIHDQIVSNEPAVDVRIKENLPSPEEIRKQVQEILDRDVNPSIAAHGGFVNLLDVKDNNLYLEFGGGCQGCGMANITLKYGVERHLRMNVPAIGEIFDTTDHAGGKNPYYSPPSE